MATFRLGTYNIRKGRGASGRQAGEIGALATALKTLNLDVMLCQEVYHGPTRALQQSHVLSETLARAAYYVPNRARRKEHSGNASFTAYAVDTIINYDISTNPFERRGALYTRLCMQNRFVHIFNVHLGLNQPQRLRQIRRVGEIIGATCKAAEPVVIAGDCNDWTGRINREVTGTMGFVNALGHLHGKQARTFHASRPLLNLDRVYVKNLSVLQGTRLAGAPWSHLSDHLPLWCELRLLDV